MSTISITGPGNMARLIGVRAVAGGNALAQGGPLDVLIAGDDAQAKASVSTFIESLGLRPLDAGPLAMARWLEGTALVMMGLGRYGVGNFNFTLDVNTPG